MERLLLRDDQWARLEPFCAGKQRDRGVTANDNCLSAWNIDPLSSPLRCLGSPEAQGVPRGDADSGDNQKGPAGGATRWEIH